MNPTELEALIRARWNFTDPQASLKAMTGMAAATSGGEQLIWQTQIARALGLQGRFDEANAMLDEIRPASDHHVLARIAIEKGRVLNSSGDQAAARPFFELALEDAELAGTESLAVDALHMLAIVASSYLEAKRLGEAALARAESSSDPDVRRWRGSILNNLGWAHYDEGRLAEALACFEKALILREEEGSPASIEHAREAVAATKRALGA